MSCWIHKWSKWGTPIEVRVTYLADKSVMVQERTCGVCGEVQRREVGGVPVEEKTP